VSKLGVAWSAPIGGLRQIRQHARRCEWCGLHAGS
jgi:hypothetical protein